LGFDGPIANRLGNLQPDRRQTFPQQLEQNFAGGRRHRPMSAAALRACLTGLKYAKNLSDAEIAELFNVSVYTIADWKKRKGWVETIQELSNRQLRLVTSKKSSAC